LSARRKAAAIGEGLQYAFGDSQFGAGGAIEIRGFGDRDNPLRRRLASAYSQDELYVRFLLRYDAASLDRPGVEGGDGEFFVLWLDDIDGSDGAVHNTNVPNIGLHTPASGPQAKKNLFMVRIGSNRQAFTNVEVEGDRTYLIVGRLAKSTGGAGAPFDTFQVWIDPRPEDAGRPLATSTSSRGVSLVRWVGFATGKKTEPNDRIVIDELALGSSWESVLGLPEAGGGRSSAMPSLGPVDFRRDVFPILKTRCFECHSGAESESGIRLDTWEEILGHSTGNPLVVAGDDDASLLIQRVTAEGDQRMPPDGPPLDEEQIAVLKRWIDQGLEWDEELLPTPMPETDHWAFQPIERPPIPKPANSDWVRNPIDAFIAAGHAGQVLSPSSEAEPLALARRAAFGLTGLPPAPEDVEQLAGDASPAAYERFVDRLLSSPQYGERWARHWLDVARWGESNDYQHNNVRRHAWRYRDYVVRSFNSDKPYDRFLREQLAGDEMAPYADEQIIATGFLAAARVSGNEMDERIRRNNVLVDIVNATSSAMLGLTLECAQCHNHKFDPVTARDYYQMQAFFAKGQLGNLVLRGDEQPDSAAPKSPPQTFGFYAPSTSPTAVTRLPMEEIRYPLPFDPYELAEARTHLLIRGEVDSLGPVVSPAWPAVLGRVEDRAAIDQRPRTMLADWLTARENPLTARVWVNRIWHYHFGRGLVQETNDFGARTEPPLHKDLLDWLAAELMEGGWSTRRIQRLIVTSSTYRQGSKHNAQMAAIDPDNHYYWRWTPRRLEAEAIRDAVLAVSGQLDLSRGGPSVAADSPDAESRRSLYLLQKRQELPEMQTLFDGNTGVVSCGRRDVSTVPLQPLYLLNNPFMVRQAEALAKRVAEEAGGDLDARVITAFRRTLAREPDGEELARAIAYLESSAGRTETGGDDWLDRRFVHFCHALINLNEFCYVH
jgi:hypothetical protein